MSHCQLMSKDGDLFAVSPSLALDSELIKCDVFDQEEEGQVITIPVPFPSHVVRVMCAYYLLPQPKLPDASVHNFQAYFTGKDAVLHAKDIVRKALSRETLALLQTLPHHVGRDPQGNRMCPDIVSLVRLGAFMQAQQVISAGMYFLIPAEVFLEMDLDGWKKFRHYLHCMGDIDWHWEKVRDESEKMAVGEVNLDFPGEWHVPDYSNLIKSDSGFSRIHGMPPQFKKVDGVWVRAEQTGDWMFHVNNGLPPTSLHHSWQLWRAARFTPGLQSSRALPHQTAITLYSSFSSKWVKKPGPKKVKGMSHMSFNTDYAFAMSELFRYGGEKEEEEEEES